MLLSVYLVSIYLVFFLFFFVFGLKVCLSILVFWIKWEKNEVSKSCTQELKAN